ncbi:hypothetical protein [Streptomyces sp. NPDC002666]
MSDHRPPRMTDRRFYALLAYTALLTFFVGGVVLTLAGKGHS